MFSVMERLIIIIDPLRIFYGLLVVFFIYFAWQFDNPIPIIIIIRRNNRNALRIHRIQVPEIQENDTEVEDLTPDVPEPSEVPELPQESGPEEIIREMDNTNTDLIRRRNNNPDCTQHIQDRINEIPDCETDGSPGSIKIKLKFINDIVKITRAQPSDLISDFKSKFFKGDTESDVKLIYRGHVLNDSKSIAESGISDESVVHCSISKKKSETGPSLTTRIIRQRAIPEHQILLIYFGMFLVTCVTLFCWYYRIQHSYMFSTFSTIGLGLMTSLFLTMLHLMTLIER